MARTCRPGWIARWRGAVTASALLIIALSACAAPPREESFTTYPAGAVVRLATGQKCVTPCSIVMQPGREVEAAITREGCEDIGIFKIMPYRDARISVWNALTNKREIYVSKKWWVRFRNCLDKPA